MKENLTNNIAYLFDCKSHLWADFRQIYINDHLKKGFLENGHFFSLVWCFRFDHFVTENSCNSLMTYKEKVLSTERPTDN